MLCVKCMLTHFISVTALALVTCDLLECVNIETYSWVQLFFFGGWVVDVYALGIDAFTITFLSITRVFTW
jgi:hypothetical protein